MVENQDLSALTKAELAAEVEKLKAKLASAASPTEAQPEAGSRRLD